MSEGVGEVELLAGGLEQTGVRLSLTPQGKLRVEAPAGLLTPSLRQRIAQHKASLVQRLSTARPAQPCPCCKASEWWWLSVQSTAGPRGFWQCGVCHPNPCRSS